MACQVDMHRLGRQRQQLLGASQSQVPSCQAQRPSVGLGIGRRGRPKQSKAHNLLKRLRNHRADVWRFMTDKDVPFTNHLAEQALRMCKVKQKANLHVCLLSVFQGQPIQSCFVA
jgi:Transposase IS66 family